MLPCLLVMGTGSGLSISPAFSTGTFGLPPKDAGVGSATLNTSAATSYLAGRAPDLANVQAAQLHGYTTVFLRSAAICVGAALITGLVLRPGSLKTLLAPEGPEDQNVPGEPGSGEAHQARLCSVRIACR